MNMSIKDRERHIRHRKPLKVDVCPNCQETKNEYHEIKRVARKGELIHIVKGCKDCGSVLGLKDVHNDYGFSC
jgi:RNase P subunit RPR2|tara:strand:- start:569 stop:787 length:219 start_codon:yes stop_codon:yes gene_type:complete